MITVAVYNRSVPNQKSQEKIDMLRHFASGVARCGDSWQVVEDYNLANTQVGVIQGWISDRIDRPHLKLRQSVIQHQRSRAQSVCTADSNLFLYANTANPQHYLRYSFNDVFPGSGIYCDDAPDPGRWAKISTDLNIALRDYRSNGAHILICLQRNGGWSMNGVNVLDWAANTILELRQYTDRPIVIRPHPGDKSSRSYIGQFNNKEGPLKNVALSREGSSLSDDLKNCWAAVNHNSSPVVGAAIEGYPIFVTDPTKSQCRDIANTDLSRIESPQMLDRLPWIQRLSMSHWSFDEVASGQCWSHMRKYI